MNAPTLHDLDSAADLRALARAAIDGDLCSLLIGVFARGIQEDMGFEPGYWTKRLAREIEASGRHHTPREVAAILEAEEGAASEHDRRLGAAIAVWMIAAGFHEHRGQWRRRRMAARQKPPAVPELPPPGAPLTREQEAVMLARTGDGDRELLPHLR